MGNSPRTHSQGSDEIAKVASKIEKLGWMLLGQNLGRGGQGDVELVTKIDDPNGTKFAFKYIGERGGSKAVNRFRQELAALASIDHPNIVKVVEYSKEDAEFHYYVMKYIDGAESLARLVQKEKNPFFNDPEKSIDGFMQLLRALKECERLKIVHRDLSPANVLVTPGDRILLIDFGLCQIEDGERVTLTDEAVGTPSYRPPDCTGYSTSPVDVRADLYSAGKLLWTMITNKIAFDREDRVFKDLTLSILLPNTPMSWRLHHIFERTIRHNPDDRYRSTAEALEDVSRIRRLIIEAFPPLEKLAGDTCLTCGIGSFHYLNHPYYKEIDEFLYKLNAINRTFAICSTCFTVSLQAKHLQVRSLADRSKLS